MIVAQNVIKQFFISKFSYLGAGFYSCVFESTNKDIVYKVGRTLQDPFLNYIKEFSGKNKHSPVIHKLYEDKENNWYFAVMERLQKHNRFDIRNMSNYEDSLVSLVNQLTSIAKKEGYALDLHSENVMQRSNTVVVTDPFSGSYSGLEDEEGTDCWVDSFFAEMNEQ